jgi:predicted CoA-binding protein
MNTKKEIDDFISCKRFAFVGISGDSKKFSRMAYKELNKKGYDIVPVNPELKELDGKPCFSSVQELPSDVTHALFMTPKARTPEIVSDAIMHGIKSIWIQQGAVDNEELKKLESSNVNIVGNKCILMFAAPVKGIHKFHRFFARIFGKVPA